MCIPLLALLPGISLADKKTTEKINFSMVFFVSACLGIGVVGAEVGFGEFLATIAVPLLSGKRPMVASIAFMFFGVFRYGQFFHDTFCNARGAFTNFCSDCRVAGAKSSCCGDDFKIFM